MFEVPLISSTQRIVIYETKSRFYVVGSNNSETKFRVLNIDRTEPRELVIHDDKVVYTRSEIKNLLTMIEAGNRSKPNVKSTAGLAINMSAYGIVGFVRFLEGYYLILITKRRKAALIGPHMIYKIEDTCMIYIPHESVRVAHPDEARYEKMFQNVDLSSNFYFSYSYDLTHTLQYHMTPTNPLVPDNSPTLNPASKFCATWPAHKNHTTEQLLGHSTDSQPYIPPTGELENLVEDSNIYGIKNQPTMRYVWNAHLLSKFEELVHPDWVIYVIHGFIRQSNVCVFGKPIFITLLARRSNQFAGTRFLKRGSNFNGDVANEVETEQIVHDASSTFLEKAKVCSYVQHRGSIPQFWSQDISTMLPKPPIALDQADPFAYVAGLHFNELVKRYGTPMIVLNLIKTREKRKHESTLREEFRASLDYLNQFLSPEHAIQYIGFDMARLTKRKDADVMVRLDRIAAYSVRQTGFYYHSPVHPEFWNDDSMRNIKGYKVQDGSRQTGVVRTNCVDCLDRTNTAQFAIGKCVLGYQLYTLGVISTAQLEFDTDCVRMLEEMYEEQGDMLALQYAGSQLVHRIKGYRKISPWASHSRDIMMTLSRYYSNAFSDADKQNAINLFLGVYQPAEGKANLWELPTDYYLHNKQATGYEAWSRKSYCQWWDSPVSQCLPLAYHEVNKSMSEHKFVLKTSSSDERVNSFWDYYKPYELTVFDDVLSFGLAHSIRPKSSQDIVSPFELRVRPDRRVEYDPGLNVSFRSSSFGPTLVQVKPSSPSSKSTSASSTSLAGSEGSTSSADSSEVDADFDLSNTYDSDLEEEMEHYVSLRDLSTTKEVYDFEVTNPSRGVESMYKRYVDIGKAVAGHSTSREMQKETELYPISAFKLDSCYSVEPPPISRQTRDIYTAYVMRGIHGPGPPTDQDLNTYIRYVGNKYH